MTVNELWPKVRPFAMLAAWPAFALLVVLVTLFASLPRDRIKDKIESTLSADPLSGQPGALGMDVTVGDLGLTLFSGAGITLKDVVLRSRPTKPDEKPARYIVDDATVHVGLLGLLFNRPTYTFKAHAFQGTVTGEIGLSPSEERIKLDGEGLVLTGVPSIQQGLGGLPVEATVGFKVDGVAAKQLMQNLEGTAELTIDGGVIGDGKAKLSVPGDPFLSQGITFPKLRLGNIVGKVTMTKGRANIEELRVHSADGDATLEGYADLRDPLGSSTVHAYLKFRPTETLVKREPTIELMNTALSAAKRPDGYIGFQLSGPLSAVFYLPNQNPPPGVASKSSPPPTAPSLPSSPSVPTTPTAPIGPPPVAQQHALPPPPQPLEPPKEAPEKRDAVDRDEVPPREGAVRENPAGSERPAPPPDRSPVPPVQVTNPAIMNARPHLIEEGGGTPSAGQPQEQPKE